MSTGACALPEPVPHPPANGCFDVGRIGELHFQATMAAGDTGRAGFHAQTRFEQAVFQAGASLNTLLQQLIAARPSAIDTAALNDMAVRLCVDLEHLRKNGGAGSRGSALAEIARVHLRHLPLDDLLVLRSHVKTSGYAGLRELKSMGRTVLDAIATALDEHVAWLATRGPVGALADLCQTLSKGGTVGYDDVPEQLRLLHAGMSMLRDKSQACGGSQHGLQWRRDRSAQAEDRARFMAPSVRQLHDVSLACIEDMLTRVSAPAPVGDALSRSARPGRERLDLSRVLAALGGAVRAEKIARLQRCMNNATVRFDALLHDVHGIFKQATVSVGKAGPSVNVRDAATPEPAPASRPAEHSVRRFTDQDADERAFILLRHAMDRILPGYLQSAGGIPAGGTPKGGIPTVGIPAADAALRAGLHGASQIFRETIARLDVAPDLIELPPDELHDQLMISALNESQLWQSMYGDAGNRPRAFSAV